MFKKIFIANRGEIALRIIKTARKLGIKTAVGYSAVDDEALFTRHADEAVYLGASPPADSYLNAAKIIAAAKEVDADAIHPGYGFLSENAAFAELTAKNRLTFIGPPPKAIEIMGDKLNSKKLAEQAGVNIIPGSPSVANVAEAEKYAEQIGYPIMLKAAMGGGGKGMRAVAARSGMKEAFTRASSEAASAFGDGRVFVEKFITEPRHIEIQLLADSHGNVIHLGERECSVQRRHQKVVEESPSPLANDELRRKMGDQAVALAKKVGYASAGTVEFVADSKRNFWFLEMNTRLQVEHPVTEMVTGIDLVEEMIQIAAGEKLRLSQDQVRLNGWAMEVRIYAEDPIRGFLPSSGRLHGYLPPSAIGEKSVRLDDSVEEGSRISTFYDPMIAKLITHGTDRPTAIALLGQALDEYCIRGVGNNLDFLSCLLTNERFASGRLSNHLIADEWPDGFTEQPPTGDERQLLLAVVAFLAWRQDAAESTALGQAPGHEIEATRHWHCIDGEQKQVTALTVTPRVVTPRVVTHRVITPETAGGKSSPLAKVGEFIIGGELRGPLFVGEVNGEPVHIKVAKENSNWIVRRGGKVLRVLALRPPVAELYRFMPKPIEDEDSKRLLSPMPGLLVSVAVKEGQKVTVGQELAVVEAMKMENVLRAERDGVVGKLLAEPGASLDADEAIIEFN